MLSSSLSTVDDFRALRRVLVLMALGAIAITAMVIRHQERLAKIERGMDPDAPPRS